jgi:photosystem II stability/assembly factor-like uncharacterized protein
MKRIIGLFCLIGLSAPLIAQEDWSVKMHDPNYSFEQLVNEHRQKWPTMPTEKGQGFKQVERFISLYKNRLKPDGTIPNGADVLRTWDELRHYNQSRSLAGNWYPLGPILDDATTRDHIEGVGRTSCIAFHPTNPLIMFAGTPAGGLWRSMDGGQSWTSNTDQLPTLGVSSIVIDPNNPTIIYAGTGDRDAFDSPGFGVIKSIDGGETWQLSNLDIENKVVGGLKIEPVSGRIIAATNDGLFYSNDAGATWIQSFNLTYEFKDLEMHPTNSNILYTTGNGRFYRSEDGGQSWVYINNGIGSASRMVIAVTPVAPDDVYICRAGTYEFSSFVRSTDAGLSFTEMSNEPNILGWAADGSSSGGQAWYDLCVEADHMNPGVIYLGGIRLKKSLDYGATWIDINSNFVHVDQHEMAINPHTKELFVCNDGGLYHYIENTEWADISKGLVNGQIYKLGQSKLNPNHTLTGFQDNGTAEFNGAFWKRRGGGDGFECAYDDTDETYRYHSIYYGQVYRTGPTYSGQKFGGNGELGINEEGAWDSPFLIHPDDPNTFFLGLKNVWRTRNVKEVNKDDIVWEKESNNLMGSNTPDLIALEVAQADHHMMYASEGTRKFARTLDCMADSIIWQNLSSTLPSSLSPVSCIETHPTDTNTVYIGFNRNVFKSVNGGQNWVSMTPNLPDVEVNTIVMDTTGMPEALYIGTDLGIYYKDASMTDWIPFITGFPQSARVTELEIFYGANHQESRLKATTYGRGLWESDLYGPEINLFPAVAIVQTANGTNEVFGSFEVNVSFYRNLSLIPMQGLDITDVEVIGATIDAISGGPSLYTLSCTPTTNGIIQFVVPGAVTFDLNNTPNWQSDTLQLFSVSAPEAFGPFGPGGVGDQSSIALWLRADLAVMGTNGQPASAGDLIESWGDVIGNEYEAAQVNAPSMPTLVLDDLDNPGVYFDGVNDQLNMSDVIPGRSSSAYIMVQTDSIAFNEHGWFASSRMPNGYLLHPWKNESQFHAEVLDLEGDYSGSPIYYIGDATAPHIYGYIHEQDDVHQVFKTIFDDNLYEFNGINAGLRDSSTPININFGFDFGDRFGKGTINEHCLFRRRLFSTHHNLVNNYFAAKYGVDLGPLSKYHHLEQRFEVFGIGRESEFDLHFNSKGKGIIRLDNPSALGDHDYLMIGTDNASLDFNAGGFPILSIRSDRTWGFTETGDVGEVDLHILASEYPGITFGMGIILQAADEFNVNTPTQFYPLNLVGGEWLTSIDFPISGVFTIGVQPAVNTQEIFGSQLKLYPNPTEDQLVIDWGTTTQEKWFGELYNQLGQVVYSFQSSDRKMTVRLPELNAGIYQLTLRTEESSKIVRTIVIQ